MCWAFGSEACLKWECVCPLHLCRGFAVVSTSGHAPSWEPDLTWRLHSCCCLALRVGPGVGGRLSVPRQQLQVSALPQPQPPAMLTDACLVSVHRHHVHFPAHVVNALSCSKQFAFISTLSNHKLVLWLLVALQASACSCTAELWLSPYGHPVLFHVSCLWTWLNFLLLLLPLPPFLPKNILSIIAIIWSSESYLKPELKASCPEIRS